MAGPERVRNGIEEETRFLQERVRETVQALMELEVNAQIGAGRYERSAERTTQCNGYRSRLWDTRVGSVAPAVPTRRATPCSASWSRAGAGRRDR